MNMGESVLGDHRLMSALGSLAAAVSREMSNPLAFMLANLADACEELGRLSRALHERVRGPVQEVDEGLVGELDEVREALSETAEGAHRLQSLLNDLRKLPAQSRVLMAWQRTPAASQTPLSQRVMNPAPDARGFCRSPLPEPGARSVWQRRGV